MFYRLIDNLIEYGNIIEGVVWILIGVCFAIALCWPKRRGSKLIAAINFVMFGCSDFVEYQTGAWWQPRWLMLWKGACICIMLAQFGVYLWRKRSARRQAKG